MDYDVFQSINDFTARHDAVEKLFKAYVGISEVLFVGLVLALFFIVGRNGRSWARRAAVTATLSAGLALLVAKLVGSFVDRARPFVDHNVHLLVAHKADPSFPSEHTTGAFAIAVAIMFYNRAWGTAALVLASLVGLGRIGLGLHYPSDVIGGAILGSACAIVLSIGPLGDLVRRFADWASEFWDSIATRLTRRGSTAG